MPARALRAAAVVLAAAGPAEAADLSPELLARFTRQVQPLLLNRCAAGACHGGPQAHAPQLHRGDIRGVISSKETLANADIFLGLLGPAGDPEPLVRRLSVRHPAAPTSRTLVMQPLTPRERATLEGWLVDARLAGDRRPLRDPAVAPAAHAEPAADVETPPEPPRPNRFRDLLDAATNPPDLPPPQEPQGIILGTDEPDADE